MDTFDLNVQIKGYYCIDAISIDQAKEHLPEMIDKEEVNNLLGTEIQILTTDVLNSEGGSSYTGEDGTEVHPFDTYFIVHAVVKETGSTKEEAVNTLIKKLKTKALDIEEVFLISIGIVVEGIEIE
ncbi:hypothetical protein ACFVS2_25810 [Brevibacillus sp. NPDC058079]|uniref:hypothetical protein n=1 Tax=Brevibacillus sp. NPDC058079 TaxID=3346330 RepID=UPI0036ED8DCA